MVISSLSAYNFNLHRTKAIIRQKARERCLISRTLMTAILWTEMFTIAPFATVEMSRTASIKRYLLIGLKTNHVTFTLPDVVRAGENQCICPMKTCRYLVKIHIISLIVQIMRCL